MEFLPSDNVNESKRKRVVCDSTTNYLKKNKRKMYEGACKL
jgi:hypothetical protein